MLTWGVVLLIFVPGRLVAHWWTLAWLLIHYRLKKQPITCCLPGLSRCTPDLLLTPPQRRKRGYSFSYSNKLLVVTWISVSKPSLSLVHPPPTYSGLMGGLSLLRKCQPSTSTLLLPSREPLKWGLSMSLHARRREEYETVREVTQQYASLLCMHDAAAASELLPWKSE